MEQQGSVSPSPARIALTSIGWFGIAFFVLIGVGTLLPERADALDYSNATVFGLVMAAFMEWRRRKAAK
jgi:hypothetical protein